MTKWYILIRLNVLNPPKKEEEEKEEEKIENNHSRSLFTFFWNVFGAKTFANYTMKSKWWISIEITS